MKRLVSVFIVLSAFFLALSVTIFCDFFELQLVESGLVSYFYSGLIARLIICLLYLVAVFTAFGSGSKVVYYLGFILCGIFLLMQFKQTDSSTVIVSDFYFLKNHYLKLSLLLISCFLFSIKAFSSLSPEKRTMRTTVFQYIVTSCFVAGVFIYNPLFPEDFYDISKKSGLEEYTPLLSQLEEESDDSKKLFAYFSTACPYCEIASKRLAVLSKMDKDFPEVKVFFIGSEEGVKWFFDETQTNFNHQIIDQELFIRLTQGRFPKMMVVKNSQAERLFSGRSFNYTAPQLIIP